MEVIFNKLEIEKAVAAYAKSKSIDPETVQVGVFYKDTNYPFPPNIGEMLSFCTIKAVVGLKDEADNDGA